MTDTCAMPACGQPVGDDGHWSTVLLAWICADCCDPCPQPSDGSGPESRGSDRVPLPGDHDTTSAARTAGVDVSAAIRAPLTDPVFGGAYIVCDHCIHHVSITGCDACRCDAYVMEIVRLRALNKFLEAAL